MTSIQLIQHAKTAMQNAYAPYSKFKVGAALLDVNGNVYTACNVENASFGATLCAERNAFGEAISLGINKFHKIAVVSNSDNFCYPCGICLQVMAEFCYENFEIILSNGKEIRTHTLKSLLPQTFTFTK